MVRPGWKTASMRPRRWAPGKGRAIGRRISGRVMGFNEAPALGAGESVTASALALVATDALQ